MINMKLVECVKERELSNLIVGNKYWIDETTKYKDSDGDEYVKVYLDKTKEKYVGKLLISHFKPILN